MQSASCLSFTQEKHFHGITAGQIPIDWSWRWASNVREDKGKAEEKQIVFPSLANHLYSYAYLDTQMKQLQQQLASTAQLVKEVIKPEGKLAKELEVETLDNEYLKRCV